MNYCNGSNPQSLSALDILGVQKIYGRKPQWSLVGYGGMCADIKDASGIPGTPIVAVSCQDQVHGGWSRETTNQRFKSRLSRPNLSICMRVSGPVSPNSPTPVVNANCPATGVPADQTFPLVDMEWRGMGNMCATANSAAGNVTMQRCDGSPAQKWTFFEGNTTTPLRFDQIRSTSTGLCMAAGTTSGTLGEQLTLRACSTSDTRQRFMYPGQGIIGFGSFCMNVLGASVSPGSVVGLGGGCAYSPRPYNAQFTLSGPIRSLGQCLDSTTPSQISVSTCTSGNAKQIWEYYF